MGYIKVFTWHQQLQQPSDQNRSTFFQTDNNIIWII